MKPGQRVYFIKPVGLGGPIKIGSALDVEERLSFLSRWSPLPLELIGSICGSRSDEAYIHSCFADLHTHGEWFSAEPRLVTALQLILDGGMQFVRSNLSPEGRLPWMTRSLETRNKISLSLKGHYGARRGKRA
jgi:hypothetical protein